MHSSFDPEKKQGVQGLLQARTVSDHCSGNIVAGKQTVVASVQGSWLDGLICNDVSLWEIHRDKPSLLIYDEDALAADILSTDSRFRQDVRALARGDVSAAIELKRSLRQNSVTCLIFVIISMRGPFGSKSSNSFRVFCVSFCVDCSCMERMCSS